jgi:hypothetical protein
MPSHPFSLANLQDGAAVHLSPAGKWSMGQAPMEMPRYFIAAAFATIPIVWLLIAFIG